LSKKKKAEPDLSKLLKLDLACGQNKQARYHGVDFVAMDGVDTVHDLTVMPWPFEAGSVGAVHCSHFIEHLDGQQQIAFMEELYRVMVPGAQAVIIAPYYTSMRAWQDPTHRRSISEACFLYYNKQWRHDQKLDHYPITCDFDFSYAYILTPDWAQKHHEAVQFAIRHYWNVVNDLHVTLTRR